jgi:elongation factor 3
VRGLREKSTAIKRQCAKIISNMSKLVEHVMEAAPFLPELIPALDKAREEVSDPEARAVCDGAYMQLKTIEAKVAKDKSKKADHPKILGMLKEKAGGSWEGPAGVAADFAAQVMCSLCDAACFKEKEWEANLMPYLTPFASADKLAAPLKALLDQCLIDMTPEEEEEEQEDAEELCNCKFTLAYGTKVCLFAVLFTVASPTQAS